MRLHFTDLSKPGITRIRRGKGWRFLSPGGETISCAETRARLLSIALPPAYRQAWFNEDPRGHIQAIGVDARGRRQYRYHPQYRLSREAAKYEGLQAFGEALPRIRAAVSKAFASRRIDRDRVIAAVVRLLDSGHIRVGNEAYARENNSFGATTLRRRHLKLSGQTVTLSFRGKSGIERRMKLSDRALATTIRRCQELPGQHLFCYLSAEGNVHPISSEDVNDWLREAAGAEISARQFRTWWASVTALSCVISGMNRRGDVLECVSSQLGNTPTVARKSYIHPRILELVGHAPPAIRPRGSRSLQPEERLLMGFLAA